MTLSQSASLTPPQLVLDGLHRLTKATLLGPLPLKLELDAHPPYVALDGGFAHLAQRDQSFLENTWFVGDGDSFDLAKLPVELEGRCWRLPVVKDRSDLGHALELMKNCTQIVGLGLIGGSLDHQLIVLGEFFEWLRQRDSAVVELDQKVLGLTRGTHNLSHCGVFSLFSFAEITVRLTGAVSYPLATHTKISPGSSLALSNRAQGQFQLESSHPLFVIKREESSA
jgi:thiamine pyrophosphokinase